jgi:hypothetical protein
VTWESWRRVCRRMSKSESTIVESGDDQRDLTGGGLNTDEGPETDARTSGQKKAVRH